jgi:hypothetical protein
MLLKSDRYSVWSKPGRDKKYADYTILVGKFESSLRKVKYVKGSEKYYAFEII